MHDRTFGLARFAILFALASLASFATGCGRTSLLDDVPFDGGIGDAHVDARVDGSSDASSCNANTCPSGCCDARGVCEQGGALASCGAFGEACRDCTSGGYDFCDTQTHACGRTTNHCDFNTCSDGCCEGNDCLAGVDVNECGISGQSCQHCAQSALACDTNSRSCTTKPCNPSTCSGCCLGDVCEVGTDQNACGNQGQQCANCLTQDEACTPASSAGGGTCVPLTCNGQNCAGCCDGNTCRSGTDTFACGEGGQQCEPCPPNFACDTLGSKGGFCSVPAGCSASNCKGCCQGDTCMSGTDSFACGIAGQLCQFCPSGDQCTNNQCQGTASCNGQNCAGCCDAQGICEGGFLSGACGSGGAACNDCGALGTTCETGATPRVCRNPSPTCPLPYSGCSSGLTETVYPVMHVCTANDLQQAQAACATANSQACQNFFSFEVQNNPSCAKCLTPFDVPFTDGTGILACTAPFVDPTCNHDSACFTDCVSQSCIKCPGPAAQNACSNSVRTGQCSSLANNLGCVGVALQGAGSFCNPQNYPGFGGWLQGVGGHYCGP